MKIIVLLAMGITFIIMIISDLIGCKMDLVQNITLYFVAATWLRVMKFA